MMKLLKILGGIFVGLVLLGMLLPDPKKDKAAGNALAANTAEAAPAASEAATAPAAEEKPDLEILKSSESVNEFARTVHVKVRNNTDHLMSYADLKSVYYNKKGDIVGTGMGNVSNIAAGATKTIDVMAMGVDNAHRYEVEVGNTL